MTLMRNKNTYMEQNMRRERKSDAKLRLKSKRGL